MTAVTKKATTFPAMLESFKLEIARALPRHLNADRMARIALTAFRRNPRLGDCDPRSVFAAVIQASQLGLEPDTLGRSYLVPHGTECTLVPGWRGLVDLVNRAGNAVVWTGAVRAGDEFEYALGDKPYIIHRPGDDESIDAMRWVYAVGRVKGAEWPVLEVWSMGRVRAHRDRYNKVGKRHYSYENPEMYARKIVLLQVLKYMPASPELAAAVALSYASDHGSQGLTVKDAIEGTWAPTMPPEEEAHGQEAAPAAQAQEEKPSLMPKRRAKPEATPAVAPAIERPAVLDQEAPEILGEYSVEGASATPPREAQAQPPAQPTAKAAPPQDPGRPASDAQRRMIGDVAKRLGFSEAALDEALAERFAVTLGTLPLAMVNVVLQWLRGQQTPAGGPGAA